MAYDARLDWEFEDDITEGDVNRWEKGIDDAHKLLEKHTVAISALQIDVKTIKDAVFNNFTDNVFFENFATLNDITLTEGWYDEANKRLVVL
ncbi:hypothetical protein O0555_21385 [Brevibacillus laterosporus]|uniref:hypothetical protein n=1 Tax=Bacillales TaxID=1385 RepID=UPI000F8ECCC4|nr:MULTISPECIES: hypothetical protein [Bacillales]MCR8939857.1 hypothetical protein [Brevibacillus laterosporus]MCZ0842497.1 hypothetical protein [Brevibacillus laterosporus]MCZ0847816.1 hypothetical protein [Brevibacillus laterosporus]RUR57544.1 hypothetical protein ELS81_31610 [Bacillus sp. VKPM B-3276]